MVVFTTKYLLNITLLMWVANEDAKKSQQHQKIFLPIKDTMRKAGKTA